METLNLIGGAWLAGRYGLNLVTPLAVQSRIGGRRRTEWASPVFLFRLYGRANGGNQRLIAERVREAASRRTLQGKPHGTT